jgi:hypothetical protein
VRSGPTRVTHNSSLYLSIIAVHSSGLSRSRALKLLRTVWYVGLYEISAKAIVSRSPLRHSRSAFCVYVAASVIEGIKGL